MRPMEGDSTERIVILADGDIRAWIEQEAIHIKAVDSHGDPVELSVDEARTLAEQLSRLVQKIDDQ